MESVIQNTTGSPGGVLEIDGANSRLSKSVLGVIVHNKKLLLIAYPDPNLRLETIVKDQDMAKDSVWVQKQLQRLHLSEIYAL